MAEGLKKSLGLFDVYCIAISSMFSAGFFLLPGLAAVHTGTSVLVAYFLACVIVLPTIFSLSELAPAMPRAGGTYYIIDRSLGPLPGTVAGYGSWLALMLKSCFSLIGVGAYLSVFFGIPVTGLAILLTVCIATINILGIEESAIFLRILIITVVVILAYYVIQGLSDVFGLGLFDLSLDKFHPFFKDGIRGLFAATGTIFIAFAGLMKVAGVSEEVKDPDKNIPGGMFLALITAFVFYILGVFVMVVFLRPSVFHGSDIAVAKAGEVFMHWLPGQSGVILVVIAAVAAFTAAGNAALLSASRFPFAMGRDNILSPKFAETNKRSAPAFSIICTALIMIFIIAVFDIEQVAEIGSAFLLLLFALLNLAVIVMRESEIEAYDPYFKAPLYPWLQIAGFIVTIYLIIEIGFIAISLTVAVAMFALGWYYFYVYGRVKRQGAVFHIYERLGRQKDYSLEHEMRGILREKGLRDEDPYEAVAGRAAVIDVEDTTIGYDEIVEKVCIVFARKLGMDKSKIYDMFNEKRDLGDLPIGRGAALKHIRVAEDILPEMVLVRIKNGLVTGSEHFEDLGGQDGPSVKKLYAMIFLVSSENRSSQHLRFLAHIVEMVDSEGFLKSWQDAKNKSELRQLMLRDERFISFTLERQNRTEKLIGKQLKDINLPGESLINLIKRDGKIKIPHGNTQLKEGDKVLIIGETDDINELKEWCHSTKSIIQ
jgi:amino acid transporter/mannitol/fructose-specific phosphotransferase system IIA component (Ntr-type)